MYILRSDLVPIVAPLLLNLSFSKYTMQWQDRMLRTDVMVKWDDIYKMFFTVRNNMVAAE